MHDVLCSKGNVGRKADVSKDRGQGRAALGLKHQADLEEQAGVRYSLTCGTERPDVQPRGDEHELESQRHGASSSAPDRCGPGQGLRAPQPHMRGKQSVPFQGV